MFDLRKIFKGRDAKLQLSKDEIADMLKVSPEAYEAFEKAYATQVLGDNTTPDNLFDVNAKMAAEEHAGLQTGMSTDMASTIDDMITRIVDGLLSNTNMYEYDGQNGHLYMAEGKQIDNPVTNAEIKALPEELRPQLTESLMKVDIPDSGSALLMNYHKYLNAKDDKTAKQWYNMFRQGLDILDYSEIMYRMIDTNPNSMGHWFPQLVEGVKTQDFFKLPKTKIIQVPMPLLQLTRLDYTELTPTTISIVDKFVYHIFGLDQDKEYFIKTGTYSSKFDFRNAHVKGPKEVRELGEYLLFIHFQANMMASPLSHPVIYGVSTTTEWVVREFIQDKENNPCIYKGLPLHTEYRVFVDFDTDEILGISQYWEPETMKKHFGHADNADSPHNIHDYVIYKAHEETLMRRYEDNKDIVLEHLTALIPEIDLSGQWSIDIMQNGDDFWIIDMALAQNSAFVECVDAHRLKRVEENWLPDISMK